MMLQDLAQVATGVLSGNLTQAASAVLQTAYHLSQLATGDVPPEAREPYSSWAGTEEPWDPATLGSDPNPAFDPDPSDTPPGDDDEDDNGWPPPFPSPPCEPLVLDLDGHGVELVSVDQSQAHFDFDGDGFREKTGWVSADDGTLVADRNQNGVVDGG